MNARLLLIDNYDSFTYNLVQAFLVLGAHVDVHRNDAVTVADAGSRLQMEEAVTDEQQAGADEHLQIARVPTGYDLARNHANERAEEREVDHRRYAGS